MPKLIAKTAIFYFIYNRKKLLPFQKFIAKNSLLKIHLYFNKIILMLCLKLFVFQKHDFF